MADRGRKEHPQPRPQEQARLQEHVRGRPTGLRAGPATYRREVFKQRAALRGCPSNLPTAQVRALRRRRFLRGAECTRSHPRQPRLPSQGQWWPTGRPPPPPKAPLCAAGPCVGSLSPAAELEAGRGVPGDSSEPGTGPISGETARRWQPGAATWDRKPSARFREKPGIWTSLRSLCTSQCWQL